MELAFICHKAARIRTGTAGKREGHIRMRKTLSVAERRWCLGRYEFRPPKSKHRNGENAKYQRIAQARNGLAEGFRAAKQLIGTPTVSIPFHVLPQIT